MTSQVSEFATHEIIYFRAKFHGKRSLAWKLALISYLMKLAILRISELLDAAEVMRILYRHPQALPVLYVAGVVADARVEDVV